MNKWDFGLLFERGEHSLRNHVFNPLILLLLISLSARANDCPPSDKSTISDQVDSTYQDAKTIAEAFPRIVPAACHKALTPDECALFQRYQAAKEVLVAQGKIPPSRIADVLARRFIGPADWVAAKIKGIYDPTKVYQPAPQTWKSWEEARILADKAAEKNLKQGRASPITLQSILDLHSAGMSNLDNNGGLRTRDELGLAIDHDDASYGSELPTFSHFEYRNERDPKQPLLKWVPKICKEDWGVPAEEILTFPIQENLIPDLKDPTATYLDDRGVARQCGYFEYIKGKDIPREMQRWLADTNLRLASLSAPKNQADPVALAARAQRWLAAIHPFAKGNGRTSRLVMDQILESVGLPSPVLVDPERDLGTPEKAWTDEIKKGILIHIQILEECAKPEQSSKPNCQVVP